MQKFSKKNIQQHFNKAATSYDEAAVLQKEVALRVAERLELTTLKPNTILDMGAGTGLLTEKIIKQYPNSKIIAMDLSSQMLDFAKEKLTDRSVLTKLLAFVKAPQTTFVCADANRIPLASHSVDLITCNLMLQWCDDLDAVLSEFKRVIRPEGLLMLTSFGPDTLKELRKSWQAVDDKQHVNMFIDMHDMGDALVRNGFGQPVMDTEIYTLTYQKPIGVLKDLKAIGATNATASRDVGLMGKQKFNSMLKEYEKFRTKELIPATFEVIHGHAWSAQEVMKGPNRNKSSVYEISLDDLGTIKKKTKQR